jgi:hypothetical protein
VATVMRSSVGHRFTPLMVILGWIQRKSIGILLVYSVRFITDMTAHKCNKVHCNRLILTVHFHPSSWEKMLRPLRRLLLFPPSSSANDPVASTC